MASPEVTALIDWDSFEKIGSLPASKERQGSRPQLDIMRSRDGFIAAQTDQMYFDPWYSDQGFALDDTRQIHTLGGWGSVKTVTSLLSLEADSHPASQCRRHTRAEITPQSRNFQMCVEGFIPKYPGWILSAAFAEGGGTADAKLTIRNDRGWKELELAFDANGSPKFVYASKQTLLRKMGISTVNQLIAISEDNQPLSEVAFSPQLVFNAFARYFHGEENALGLDLRQSAISGYNELQNPAPDPLNAIVFLD